MKVTSLNGRWELLPVSEFQDRYPDGGWLEMEIPSHWQQHSDLESYAGRVVYRKSFEFRPAAGKRYWLRLNGVFYRSAVRLNGALLGGNEGYFFPQQYEVTGVLRGRNTLLVEVECPNEDDKSCKTLITGVFSHWDALDPKTNPGGIWLPVEIVPSGEVCIEHSQLRLDELGEDVAKLRAELQVDAVALTAAEVRVAFAPHNFEGKTQVFRREVQLRPGSSQLSIPVELKEPRLWWCHDQGFPHLYRVTAEVRTADGKSLSDRVEFNYGLRTFEMRDWTAHLNGRRVFLKGNNYGPGDTRIASMNRERCQRDLELARDANMNMLRLHAHIDHPAFYEAADELGMLIWQDFPLQWNYSKEILPEALRQVELMVQRLYNHPSVVIWCTHNEPGIQPEPNGRRWWWIVRTLFSLQLYNWNRERMDSQLKRKVEELDDTRFVVRSAGEWHLPLLRQGTDSHLYYGWYLHQDPSAKLESMARRLKFVSEFGAQSFPNYESSIRFMNSDLSRVDWDRLEGRHGLQREIMDRWLDLSSFRDLQGLIDASQDYQTVLNRSYIDRLRYQKYRPAGGVLAFCFHDPNPAVQWSVLDYWRLPKRSYYDMQRVYHPQYVFTLLRSREFAVGQEIAVPIYVVNDSPEGYDDVAVSVEILGPDGERTTHAEFSSALRADSEAELVRLLHLRFREPGKRLLRLRLEYAGDEFENEYPLLITSA
jgi:beta-mannosidase